MYWLKPRLLILILVPIHLFGGCTSPETNTPYKRTQFLMGTLVEITISGADEKVAALASSKAFDEIGRIEKLMSTYIKESEVSQINENSGKNFIAVSPDVLKVIQSGVYWAKESNGALDITIGPIAKLWNFENQNPLVPSQKELKKAISLVNFQDIEISKNKIRLARSGMNLNLGSIAKGYAVDLAYKILKGLVPNGIINAGGDLIAFGKKDPEHPWIIGLQHPRKPQNLLASFGVEGIAVATSGDYQKYFEKEGKRYHHILNPSSGRPAEGLTSVTVSAPTVMEADAIATAIFVMGSPKGLSWVENLEGTEAMLVLQDGNIQFSSGFKNLPQFVLRTSSKDN